MATNLPKKGALKRWRTIVNCDDDTVSSELMSWAGLYDVWDKYALGDRFDFTNDVADGCVSIDIEREEWDANLPGRNGVWHKVQTNDAKALKRQLRESLARLISNIRVAERSKLRRAVASYREFEIHSAEKRRVDAELSRTRFLDILKQALEMECPELWTPQSHEAPSSDGWRTPIAVLKKPFPKNTFLLFEVLTGKAGLSLPILCVSDAKKCRRHKMIRYVPVENTLLPLTVSMSAEPDKQWLGLLMFLRIAPDLTWISINQCGFGLAPDSLRDIWRTWVSEHPGFSIKSCSTPIAREFLQRSSDANQSK